MRTGIEKITKAKFYELGGLRNPSLFRNQKGNGWAYYRDHTHPAADPATDHDYRHHTHPNRTE